MAEPVFTFPTPRYKAIEHGIPQGKSEIESLLQLCNIQYDKFITRIEATKVSTL